METVQQNDRFTLFSSKFHSNIYSILFDKEPNYSQHCNQCGVSVSTNYISSVLDWEWVLNKVITRYALLYTL